MMVPEIQVKKAKRDILTYLHTDQPSHRVSYKLTKKAPQTKYLYICPYENLARGGCIIIRIKKLLALPPGGL